MMRGLSMARAQGIIVEWGSLPPGYRGVYCLAPGEPPAIILARCLRHKPLWLQRSVFYEELGHHFSLLALGVCGRWSSEAVRVNNGKQEAAALRWAARNILTAGEWEDARRLAIETVEELAEFWQVSVELAGEIMRLRREATEPVPLRWALRA